MDEILFMVVVLLLLLLFLFVPRQARPDEEYRPNVVAAAAQPQPFTGEQCEGMPRHRGSRVDAPSHSQQPEEATKEEVVAEPAEPQASEKISAKKQRELEEKQARREAEEAEREERKKMEKKRDEERRLEEERRRLEEERKNAMFFRGEHDCQY